MITGLASGTAYLIYVYPKFMGNPAWLGIDHLRFGIIGASVCLVVMVVVSLMTPEPDKATQNMVDEVRIPSGKTILGKALASQVNCPFLDLDKKIEEHENKSIHKIFELKGELYFRQIERKVLLELINSSIPKIVSLGGGAPCYFTNMTDIINSSHQSIYFKASVDNLVHHLTKCRFNKLHVKLRSDHIVASRGVLNNCIFVNFSKIIISSSFSASSLLLYCHKLYLDPLYHLHHISHFVYQSYFP